MRQATPVRTRPSSVLLLLPLVVLTACAPDQSDRGYTTVVSRGGPPALPEATHPQPPAVPPGTTLGGASQTITLVNPPQGVTQEMVDAGQKEFGTVCAACHGNGGVGTPAAPPLNDAEWLNIRGEYPELVTLINTGVPAPKQFPGMMPPRGGGQFTPEQVNQIAAYVYALSHQGNS
jgi:mono/diheme cytochrome c family protein